MQFVITKMIGKLCFVFQISIILQYLTFYFCFNFSGDESDEVGCNSWTRCNFEYSLAACHIKTDVMEALEHHTPLSNNVEWRLRKGVGSDLFDPDIDSTLRTGNGKYLSLGFNFDRKLKQTFTSEFYSPMMTSQNQNACRMRFFYFIDGELATIAKTDLNIYIRYASKRTLEPSILRLRLNLQADLQQRWNFAAVQFTSTQPFQFVFRGVLGTDFSRIAIDDISFDPSGCLASAVTPLGPPTTPHPVTQTTGNQTNTPATPATPSPDIRHPAKPEGSNGGKIAAAILVPLFVILGVLGAFFAYQRYQKRTRSDEHITLSMKAIQGKMDD